MKFKEKKFQKGYVRLPFIAKKPDVIAKGRYSLQKPRDMRLRHMTLRQSKFPAKFSFLFSGGHF